ncbi:MAG: TonB-dependent receptor [Opitutus sp.]|nr:TonB-dependent receptor [Opitutus sp.]
MSGDAAGSLSRRLSGALEVQPLPGRVGRQWSGLGRRTTFPSTSLSIASKVEAVKRDRVRTRPPPRQRGIRVAPMQRREYALTYMHLASSRSGSPVPVTHLTTIFRAPYHRWFRVGLVLTVGSLGLAVAVLAAAVDPAKDEKVRLSPFMVTGESVGSYQAAESTSGSRIRMNLFEATSSINVATAQLLADLGATSPLNALKYFPGITRGTEPEGTGAERLTFRGYEIIQTVMDGADMVGGNNFNRNQMSAFLDRIEVVMGTDSILSPTGVPGGTMNLVTKKPQFSNFGNARVHLGEYNSNQASVDLNRRISDRLALRLINAVTYGDGYSTGWQEGFNSMLSGSWRFGKGAIATLQLSYGWGDAANGGQKGIPIDPSAGTNVGYALPLTGLEPSAGERLYRTTYIKTNRRTATLSFNSQITNRLSTRFVVRAESYDQDQTLPNVASSLGLGGAVDPRTGFWMPGLRFGGAPNFTASPAPAQNTIYQVQGIRNTGCNLGYVVQDDYAYEYEHALFRSQTMAGFALGRVETDSEGYQSSQTQLINLATENVPTLHIPSNFNTFGAAEREYGNLYVNQVFKFLPEDRLAMHAGVAKNWNRLYNENERVPNGFSATPAPFFRNYGVMFKPVPIVAAYYGHTESAQPQNPAPGTVPFADRTAAKQDEFGVRLKVLGGRGMVNVTYYQITQTNFSVLNPLNAAVPAPVPRLPNLLLDRVARGWEFQFNAAVTRELSTIVSYTDFRNRDPNGVPIRGTAETAGAVWAHYEAKKGWLEGFGFGAGFVHQSKVAGDTTTGLAAASTPTNPIPNQPSFYLPPTDLINATVSYRRGKWIFRAFLDNVTDKRFITSSISRSSTFVGLPRNSRFAIEYSF